MKSSSLSRRFQEIEHCFIVLMAIAFIAAFSSPGATYVNRVGPGGSVVQVTLLSSVWTPENSPYIVEAHISIAETNVLDIRPGVQIQLNPGCAFYVAGTMLADGAAFEKNGAGNWAGIYFGPTAGESTIQNCVLDGAGAYMGYFEGNNRYAAILGHQSAPTIVRNAIRNSAGNGVTLLGSSATVLENTFSDLAAGGYIIDLSNLGAFPTVGGNSFAGAGIPGIALPGGTISGIRRWNNPGTGLAYYINGSISVADDSSLTIDSGVSCRIQNNGFYIGGSLIANGTASAPIRFISKSGTDEAGQWSGIYFGPNAGGSKLQFCELKHGGAHIGYIHGANRYANLYIDGSSPIFEDVSIQFSSGVGAELWGSASSFVRCSFSRCKSHAILARAKSRPLLDQPILEFNGESGYYTAAQESDSVITPNGAQVKTNFYQGIQVLGGTLDQAATWKRWDNNAPYVITGDMSINEGVDFQIEPGVVVKLQGTGIYCYGVLKAESAGDPIIFTSHRDDQAAGDSNGDAGASVPAGGDWRGIYISPTSGASTLKNFAVRYAGGFMSYIHGANRYAGVYIDECSPTLQSGDVTESANQGIEFFNSNARVENVQFRNVRGYAMYLDATGAFPWLIGNSTSIDGNHQIYISGGGISGERVWTNPGAGLLYYLGGEITLQQGSKWTVAAGSTVTSTGKRIVIHGQLDVQGTAAEPVLFSSADANPAPGHWSGIYFSPTANDCRLQYCEVAYAGAYLGYFNGNNRYASVYLDGTSPVFEHLIVRSSNANGVELWNSNPIVTDADFIDNRGYGILARNQSRPVLSQARFTRNGQNGNYTAGMEGSCIIDVSGITFTDNFYSGVENLGGTLSSSGIWKKWADAAPYILTGDLTIAAGAQLQVQAGSTVKAWNSGIYCSGTLIADGSAGAIQFSSTRDDQAAGDSNGDTTGTVPAAGDWRGIYLSPNSDASLFNNVTLRFAGRYLGYFNGNNRYTTIYTEGCSPTFRDLQVTDSSGTGLELYSSSPLIAASVFRACASYPIYFNTLNCFPVMTGNQSVDNGQPGVHIPGGTIAVSGRYNKPGENFPYILPSNVSVAADVTLHIDPGVTFRMSGSGFYVGGTVLMHGLAADPIIFTTHSGTPGPGGWGGIYFASTASASRLDHVEVAYAGNYLGYYAGENRYAALFLDQASPTLRQVRIHHSSHYGLQAKGGTVDLRDSLIYQNASAGVSAINSPTVAIVNNTLYGNGAGITASVGNGVIGNNIVLSNATHGINVQGGAVVDYNCVFGNAGDQYSGVAPGEHDVQSDPTLTAPAEGQLSPMAGSPVINAGLSSLCLSSETDFSDRLRVAQLAVDIGAYETESIAATRSFDLLVRAGDSVYIGEGLFDVEQQTVARMVNAESAASYFVKGNYSGNVLGNIHLGIGPLKPGWALKVFDLAAGGIDISGAVAAANGIVVSDMPSGNSVEYRLEVTPGFDLPGFDRQAIEIPAAVEGLGSASDIARIITTNAPRNAVDLAVRRANDLSFIGKGVLNQTGGEQTRRQNLGDTGTAIFFVEAVNIGNVDDSVRLRLSAERAAQFKAFDATASGVDITAAITGSHGYTTPDLPAGTAREIRFEVSGAGLTSDELLRSMVTGGSVLRPDATDTVGMEVEFQRNLSAPVGRTYTSNADFDEGDLVGLDFHAEPDQLQLAPESITLPFIWVPNSNDGTVSKVDTRTGRELGRYRTGPFTDGSPSRTTVDLDGNCWVANRVRGTAVKIGLKENGQYVDRNGNGVIETSFDGNGDGVISPSEMLPWGQDECVLLEIVVVPGSEGTFAPGTYTGAYANDNWNPGPRGVALDSQNNLWLGTYGTKKFYKINGSTGAILRVIDVSPVNHTSYGAVIDSHGVLWSAGQDKRHVLRLNTATEEFGVIAIPHYVYGIGLDHLDHLFVSGWTDSRLTKLDVLTGEILWTKGGPTESRGIAVTGDNDVWVANSGPGTVTRWSQDGTIKATINVGNQPTGVAVDADGKVWAVNVGDTSIHRINPANNTIDRSVSIPDGYHYGYSDMTGIIARTTTTKVGTWRVIHNSRHDGAAWDKLSWNALEPAPGGVRVRARSSEDLVTWSSWESATSNTPLTTTPAGQYLEIEAILQASLQEQSPILYDLTVTPKAVVEAALRVTYKPDNKVEVQWPVEAGSDWSLQAAGQMGPETTWTTVSETPVIRDGNYVIELEAAGQARFLQLRR